MHDVWMATAGDPETVTKGEIVDMTGFHETMMGGDIESLGDELDPEAEPHGPGGSCLQCRRGEVAVRHLVSPSECRAHPSDEEFDDCDDADILCETVWCRPTATSQRRRAAKLRCASAAAASS